MLTQKQFKAKRFALIDRLRRDGDKTASTRLIGAEIIGLTNYVSGDAWPGADYLAKQIDVCIRTVWRAVAELAVNKGSPANYLHVTHTSRSNRYRPNFALLDQKQLPLEGGAIAGATCDKNDTDIGQIVTPTCDKRYPLSLLKNTDISSERASSNERERLRDSLGAAQKAPVAIDWRQSRDAFRAARAALKAGLDDDARLRDSRGDEKAEVEAARLLGDDGYSILSILHEIDRGQPRLRLLALIRGGLVTESDLEAARLAAWSASSKRKGTA